MINIKIVSGNGARGKGGKSKLFKRSKMSFL
jgi:hypothetical protein